MPVRTEIKTIYKTDDDQDFTNEQDAEEHQALLESKTVVDAFIEQLPGTDLHHKKTRNMLMKFVRFAAARKFKLDQEAEAGFSE